MKARPVHAANRIQCVDKKHRAFDTLCGLNAGLAESGPDLNPDDVTCKACRRSRAWPVYLNNNRELKGTE